MRSSSEAIRLAPPYDGLLAGVLAFRNLEEAEGTIRKLDNLRQRFRADGDKKGEEYCRQIARLGRRRAELISRNPKVGPDKRLQKREISLWFQIWLETPELFWEWLRLRRQAPEFGKLLNL